MQRKAKQLERRLAVQEERKQKRRAGDDRRQEPASRRRVTRAQKPVSYTEAAADYYGLSFNRFLL